MSQPESKSHLHISVRPDLVACAAKFVSNEKSRVHLNGVYFEPAEDGGVIIVATDGHTMTVLHDPDGECSRPAIVKFQPTFLHSLKRQTKARRKANEPIALVVEAVEDMEWLNQVFLCPRPDDPVDAEIFYCAEIDETFPDWRRVTPKAPTEDDDKRRAPTVPFLNTDLVNRIAKAVALVATSREYGRTLASLRYHWTDEASPVVVTSKPIAPGYFVVMPLREDHEAPASAASWNGLPAFAKRAA